MFNLPFGSSPGEPFAASQPQLMAPGLIPGPVPAVPLTSGFHPPGTAGLGSMHIAPPDPGFNLKDGLALFSKGLDVLRPKEKGGILNLMNLDPTNPGVPTPQGDPTGGAGPAFLGGTTSLGADPSALLKIIDPLTGLSLLNSSWGNFRG